MDRREFLSNASVGLGATAVSISSSQSHANSLSINDPRNAANSRVIKDARTQHGMFQGNPQHTGVYSTTPAYRFMEVSFTFRTAGPIRGTPALANGRLYFGSGDGNLYAVDARSGTEHWRFRTGGPMQSSPAVADNVVYFVSSDGNLYAVDRLGGKQVWKFAIGRDLPYRNGFDYYLSSPTIVGRSLFVGGGDGNLYAFDLIRRQPRWKYFAGSMIRSSPAVADDLVMVGTMGGELLALSRADGKLKWKFATRGASLKIEDFGFDRTAIVSSPSVANGIVTFGGRDGFLYSLDLATGKQKWAYDHKISWVLSTPAIDKGNVFAGSSDGHFFQSVDQSTGAELWRFPAGAPIWSSAAIAGPMIYFGVNDGHLFAVDKHTGVEKWRYKSPDKIFGSPIVADGVVYYGCDDGNLYALAGTTTPDPKPPSARRVVFWESIPASVEKWFTDGTDEWIRNYFVREGYELVDSKGLENVMSEHLVKKSPSVIVFADNRVPQALVADESENSLIRKYLNGGGKIVWLGPDPIAWKRDSTGKLLDINYTRSQKILGIRFPGVQLEGIGWYTSRVTDEGRKWGLRGWWVGLGCVDPKEITQVLALDEHGMAGAWVKNYGGREGSGLIQLFIPSNRRVDLFSVKLAAEYGLQ